MTDEKLAEILSPVIMGDFEKATELEQRGIRLFLPILPELDDAAFLDVCTDVVSAGAVAESRQSRGREAYIKTAACMRKAERRHEAAKHDPKCGGDNLYQQGFRKAQRNFGFESGRPNPCTCGSEG